MTDSNVSRETEPDDGAPVHVGPAPAEPIEPALHEVEADNYRRAHADYAPIVEPASESE